VPVVIATQSVAASIPLPRAHPYTQVHFGRYVQDKSWTPNSGVQNLFWTRRHRKSWTP